MKNSKKRQNLLRENYIFMRLYCKMLCRYRGGLVLTSIGHHADTSQVFLSASNFTHDPVWIPTGSKKTHHGFEQTDVPIHACRGFKSAVSVAMLH